VSASVVLDRRRAIGLTLSLLAAATHAQADAAAPAASAASAASQVTLDAELVKTGLYLITGGGSNSLLRLSAAGSILVDGKQAGTYRALMSVVRRINKLSDLPLRVVIFTDHHETHAGNRAQFVAAGVAVLVQANALPRLAAVEPMAPSATATPGSRPPGPTLSFERAHEFRMGGVEVRLRHVGRACTDDSSVVLFPDLKVLALGALYTPGAPVPDFAGGGSLAGWAAALAHVLELEFDLAVPSAGPPITRADLIAYKSRLDTLVARATALVKAGVARDGFLARLDTGDLGWPAPFAAQDVDPLYAELARMP